MGLISIVTACGGGGGGGGDDGPPPEAPSVTQDTDIRSLIFNWDSVERAGIYRLLVNPDGDSGFVQVGNNLRASATSVRAAVSVHQLDWDNARFIVEACNQAGCGSSPDVGVADQMLDVIGYFKPSNTDAGDQFGHAVAVSANGLTLAVSAPLEDSGSRSIGGSEVNSPAHQDAGAVYVYIRGAEGWVQQAYIKPTNTDAFDEFGFSLALSADGDTLAVGARHEDSSAFEGDSDGLNNDVENAGAAYVFVREGEEPAWSQEGLLKATNNSASDFFGSAVALSGDGDTLAVGAIGEDGAEGGIDANQNNNAAEDAGAVYLYSRTDDGWDFDVYVKASDPDAFDNFGLDLALNQNGDTLVVGAPGEDGNAGAVYVFHEDNDQWQQQDYLKASNTEAGDFFGRSVSLSSSGNTLAAGAIGEASNATGVDGNEGNNSDASAGAVYVYSRTDADWTQQAYIKASNTGEGDMFGYSVGLSGSGTNLAVGAPFERSSAVGVGGDQVDDSLAGVGAAYFFRATATAWEQVSYVKAPNAEDGDQFGGDVALSQNGVVMAVGGSLEDADVSGVGGEQGGNDAENAGAVYLY